jgi:branched-chain amino acid transport system ATP-binding protein
MLNLVKVFTSYGSVPVLKDVSLEVPDGEIVCLLGSNGAGKSTTINTILGFIKPNSGNVLFRDEDISGKSTESIVKRGIGIVPEGRRVFPKMTVEENLLVGACACKDKSRIKENIEKAYTMFPRLRERKAQNAGTMSGGEQQMLAISRALMGEPKILLLDEPSLGLAPLVVNDIFKTIKQLNKEGMTILLIEQNGTKALEMAHRGYLMQKGELIASCTDNTAESKAKLMEIYLNQQKGKEV